MAFAVLFKILSTYCVHLFCSKLNQLFVDGDAESCNFSHSQCLHCPSDQFSQTFEQVMSLRVVSTLYLFFHFYKPVSQKSIFLRFYHLLIHANL